jgi:hypothetical protein
MPAWRFVLLSACAVACSNTAHRAAAEGPPLPDAHLSPEQSCGDCHPRHVAEWKGSAHAYAVHDPVFTAMIGYGQQQTKGALGDFCVQCHTPLGFRSGETNVRIDGEGDAATYLQPVTGLSTDAMDGVTCLVCHSITKVNKDANADFEMGMDDVRRGPISDPDPTPAHSSVYSSLHEETHVCGTCHVVVNPKHVALERTHIEWEQSIFAPTPTCQDCHMPEYQGVAAFGHRERSVHQHRFVGVDVSLLPDSDFPGYDEGRANAEALLKQSAKLGAHFDASTRQLMLEIENLAGHALPTGAVADRQMWVELVVTDASGGVVLESGTLDENGDLRTSDPERTTRPGTDPQLLLYGQIMLLKDSPSGDAGTLGDAGGKGRPVDFLWEPNAEESHLIPPSVTDRPSLDVSALPAGSYTAQLRLLFRSFPPHLLRRLEAVGGLDPAVKERVPTVEMAKTTVSFSL